MIFFRKYTVLFLFFSFLQNPRNNLMFLLFVLKFETLPNFKDQPPIISPKIKIKPQGLLTCNEHFKWSIYNSKNKPSLVEFEYGLLPNVFRPNCQRLDQFRMNFVDMQICTIQL